MALDIYSTRAQLAALEVLPREYSFLFDTFTKDAGVVEDSKAIYDYRKGAKRMAPVVTEDAGGVLMNRDGYETREIGFCTIAPERVIMNNDLKGRAFGENILGALTPEERERKMMVKDLAEMRAAIQRRKEWMARQVILTGSLSVFRYTHEGMDTATTLIANYGFTNNYVPTTKWNASGARINYDMEKIYDLVYDGMGAVDTIVMAPDVYQAMLADTTFLKQMDLRNAELGKVNQQYRGQGVRFVGHNADGIEMYVDSGTFVDDNGTVTANIPSGKLIAGSKGMLSAIYGPVTQVEEVGAAAQHKTYIKKEVPLRYGSIDGNSIKNRLTSCVTIVPMNVDGWAVATVL